MFEKSREKKKVKKGEGWYVPSIYLVLVVAEHTPHTRGRVEKEEESFGKRVRGKGKKKEKIERFVQSAGVCPPCLVPPNRGGKEKTERKRGKKRRKSPSVASPLLFT